MKIVSSSSVLEIVNDGRDEDREDFQVSQPTLVGKRTVERRDRKREDGKSMSMFFIRQTERERSTMYNVQSFRLHPFSVFCLAVYCIFTRSSPLLVCAPLSLLSSRKFVFDTHCLRLY